jgi:hypothetical protein
LIAAAPGRTIAQMGSNVIERRSQAILVLPVDNVPAVMLTHDGARADVILFVPAGDEVPAVLTGVDRFIPIIRKNNVSLVARDVIAALAVPEPPPRAPSELDELPAETQRVHVHLRSGVVIDGEMRWSSAIGRMRTTDHLNEPAPYFTMHADGHIYYVVKAHVAIVEEK